MFICCLFWYYSNATKDKFSLITSLIQSANKFSNSQDRVYFQKKMSSPTTVGDVKSYPLHASV